MGQEQNSTQKWLWVALIVILVVAGGFGWYFWNKNVNADTTGATPLPLAGIEDTNKVENTTPTINTVPVKEQPVKTENTDKTADWKTYKSEKYGYSISYPFDYSAKEWVDTIKSGAAAEANKELLSLIAFGKNSTITDHAVAITVYKDSLEHRRELLCWDTANRGDETKATINSLTFYQRICAQPDPNGMRGSSDYKGGEKIIDTVIQNGDYVYNLVYTQRELVNDDSNVFNKMLSTFQFTK